MGEMRVKAFVKLPELEFFTPDQLRRNNKLEKHTPYVVITRMGVGLAECIKGKDGRARGWIDMVTGEDYDERREDPGYPLSTRVLLCARLGWIDNPLEDLRTFIVGLGSDKEYTDPGGKKFS